MCYDLSNSNSPLISSYNPSMNIIFANENYQADQFIKPCKSFVYCLLVRTENVRNTHIS